jgi:hypothetical protein
MLRRIPHTLPRATLALLAPLTLAGCGGAKTVRVEGHELRFGLDEYRILPRDVSVPPGPLRMVVRNRGVLTHNLTLERENRDASGNAVVLASSSTIMPGATVTVTTSAPLRPGRYALLSTISNQADLGMSGTLIVR